MADYIKEHTEYYVITPAGYRLKKSLLECKKQTVKDEITDGMYNVPELFID